MKHLENRDALFFGMFETNWLRNWSRG